MTLRWRLSIALVLTVAIGAIAFGLVARATVEGLLYGDIDRNLQREVGRLVEDVDRRKERAITNPRDKADVEPVAPAGRFTRDRPGTFFGRGALIAQVLDADGTVLMRTTAVESIGGMPDPDVGRNEPRGSVELRTVRIDGERYRIAAATGSSDTVVQVARPLTELNDYLDTLRWVLAAAGLAAVGAALLLGRWAARATLRPIDRMTRTARAITNSPNELSARVEPAFPDPELRDFADAVNEMLGAIETSNLQRRRFVADASHELRTPLTSLGGNAAFLERAGRLDGDEREALEAVGRDVARLVRIADGLTMLARLDASPSTQLEPVDVDANARESVARMQRAHPSHTFRLEGSAGTCLLDVELLRRILDNLLDNAGRYTPPGSTVTITVHADDELRIEVVDDGPGLDEAERLRVVERFHRGSTSTGEPGTGLGLAIVDEAARSLDGSLELTAAEPHGLRCVVRLRSVGRAAG
jgi:two-component system sensor histidine kinase MprB